MAKAKPAKWKTAWCGGRKGKVLGPDPEDPENLTLIRYADDTVHRERNDDLSKTKPKK